MSTFWWQSSKTTKKSPPPQKQKNKNRNFGKRQEERTTKTWVKIQPWVFFFNFHCLTLRSRSRWKKNEFCWQEPRVPRCHYGVSKTVSRPKNPVRQSPHLTIFLATNLGNVAKTFARLESKPNWDEKWGDWVEGLIINIIFKKTIMQLE